MARKKTKISKGTLFARLLLASAILLFIPQNRTRHLNDAFFKLFDPVLTFAKGKGPDIFPPIPSENDYVPRSEHEMLEKEYANSIATVAKLRQKYEEIARIRINLPNETMGVVLAEVIQALQSGRNELVINKGTLDGLKKGQYVLTREANCVIGTISDTSESIARVKLLTDSKHSMPILVYRERTKSAIREQLIGNGDGTAKIPLVQKAIDIMPGDVVYAEEKPGYLQSRIIIGNISEVSPDKNRPLLLDIKVKPKDDLAKIQSVVVFALEVNTKLKEYKLD